ncbi:MULTISPECIES: ABC transporter substrate-binding protein [unclassified Paenibacillus]|uniref:ABC transporter substrate-binding protein n=1 Tax=unclassified Paenibacillus TaxID=185978 RepID=UPI000418B9C6|nr:MULTISPECIES: ABC transporter substrate-binding protein [unclassified Paenibacillus]CDN45715.1 Extracellular solute-binding protein family 1 [Paenibacillus sp. P22]
MTGSRGSRNRNSRIGYGNRTIRRIALLMGASIAVAAAAGCSGEKPAEKLPDPVQPVVLEYWTPFSGGDNIFMTELVEKFNAEHEDIRVEQINSRLDDYYSRLRTAILAGNAPDLAIVHATNLPQFVQNGYIEKLDGPAAETGLDWSMFNANIAESTLYGGGHYAVPLDTHALVLYYNKKFLRQAGLLDAEGKPILEPGEQGFAGFLERIKERVPSGIAPLALPSTRIDSVWLWWSLYNQIDGGGRFFSPDGTKAVFDNSDSLRALEFVDSLYKRELIPPGINDAFKMFHDGEAAALITGMWGTGAFEKAEGLELGVIPFPVIYDHPAVWGDTHTLALPAKAGLTPEKRKAALTFAKWAVDNGVMWAEAGHVPSSKKVVASEAFSALKFRSDYAATANYVVYWPRHVKQWTMIEKLISEWEKMIYRQQTPAQALERAAASVDNQLGK